MHRYAGNTPLLPYDTYESSKEMLVSTVDMGSAIDVVAAKMRSGMHAQSAARAKEQ